MDWYLPITILPGIGMLIFSTTGQMIAISSEVSTLLSQKCTDFQHMIADLKIKQIKRLSFASTLLYISAGLYVLSGITGAFLSGVILLSELLLLAGTFSLFMALMLLIVYSSKTIAIRQKQFDHNHNL